MLKRIYAFIGRKLFPKESHLMDLIGYFERDEDRPQPTKASSSKKSRKKSAPPSPEELPTFQLDTSNLKAQQVRLLVEMWHNSDVITYIERIVEQVEGTYSFNELEVQIMDSLVEKYQTKYKSPLAQAMSERERL